MPNGNYREPEEFSDYETYFSPIASEMEEFSRKHGLEIEKYYHDAPLWSLCFSHPSGGQAKLDVSQESEKYITVQAVWWQDSYQSFTRSLKWGEKEKILRKPGVIGKHLEEALIKVVNWVPGSWTDVAEGYEKIWGCYTQSEFEAMSPNWPLPK